MHVVWNSEHERRASVESVEDKLFDDLDLGIHLMRVTVGTGVAPVLT